MEFRPPSAVAKVFLDFWVLAYDAPVSLVSDNGSQFTAQIFEFVCSHLGVPPEIGHWACVEIEVPTEDSSTGERRQHKLLSNAPGPYRVITADEITVTLVRDGLVEKVSQECVSKALPRRWGWRREHGYGSVRD